MTSLHKWLILILSNGMAPFQLLFLDLDQGSISRHAFDMVTSMDGKNIAVSECVIVQFVEKIKRIQNGFSYCQVSCSLLKYYVNWSAHAYLDESSKLSFPVLPDELVPVGFLAQGVLMPIVTLHLFSHSGGKSSSLKWNAGGVDRC